VATCCVVAIVGAVKTFGTDMPDSSTDLDSLTLWVFHVKPIVKLLKLPARQVASFVIFSASLSAELVVLSQLLIAMLLVHKILEELEIMGITF